MLSALIDLHQIFSVDNHRIGVDDQSYIQFAIAICFLWGKEKGAGGSAKFGAEINQTMSICGTMAVTLAMFRTNSFNKY